MSRRLRLAIPNKGRLVEPTLRLLHDAGLVFEEHDRSLVALVQNYELDILFVRTNDVIEFVGDGVADLGVTGVDLLAETGAGLLQFRALGYGRCRLAAAVDTMLSAVIAARGRKYLMMNAPASCLDDLQALLPALESPTVIPLAHLGMIAIHSVVGADDVWGLLPRLKAAGASGILVLPIEKIVP